MPIRHLVSLDRFSSSARHERTGRPSKKSLKTLLLWVLGLCVAGAVVGALALTFLLAWYSRDLPDPNTLLQREIAQSTKIYDRTGTTLLYEIHGDQNRTLIKIEDIPDIMKWATISVEDKTFYTHHGLNWQRMLKALFVDVITHSKAQGASTITQQLVKNAILTNEKSFDRKLKEALLSLQLERIYTKDQILQMYFNEIPYGSTIYGIEAASQNYLGKHAKDMTLDEAALLAALPQATDYYSPYGTGAHGDNRDKLVARQHLVLDLMAEQGYVTKTQADDAKKVDTLKKILPKSLGDIRAPHFVMYIRSQLVDKYGQRAVEQGGLKVTTSLDWNLQQIAEDEVTKGVEARGPKYNFTNGSLVALDPKTGQVLVMVGSKDFFDSAHDGQVNVSLRPRQPGSSFKPIVYTAGYIKGYTPSMTLWDVNTTFKTDLKDYSPKNYDLKEHGPVSARMALQGSLNIPAVKMLYLVGVGRVLDFAEQLGYTTLGDRSRFGLSLVLGGGEVKLLEHTATYATFANEGVQMPTASILKVEDSNGKMLDEWKPSDGKVVVDPNVTRTLSDVLSDNNSRAYVFGAKNYLTLSDRPVATKTGTTNNFHDAWTVGYVPSLAAGVWVGNSNNDEMKNHADGSVVAAPIWQGFMSRATKGTPVQAFIKPQPLDTTKPILTGKVAEVKIKIDKVSGLRATDLTPPDLVVEQTFHEAHSELWYLDKDDPRGPAPTNPAVDPQFNNWEGAVLDWVKRTNWNTTSTPPTGSDDIHTVSNQPQITIVSPQPNTTWTARQAEVNVSVTAVRRIVRTEASMEGNLIGSSPDGVTHITVNVPNSIGVGFHDLTMTAIDDVGNRGSATVTINLTADTAPVAAVITSPAQDAHFTAANFPTGITVNLTDLMGVTKIDVFQQETQTGDTHLLASIITPTQTSFHVSWNTPPPPGTYYLYPILVMTDGTSKPGAQVTVHID